MEPNTLVAIALLMGLAAAVLGGALVGTWLGAGRLPKSHLLQGLGVVLVIAGAKLNFA